MVRTLHLRTYMDTGTVLFHDKDALLYRLHDGLLKTAKEVVFVVGAPLTAPYEGSKGVSDVSAVVELIRSEFVDKRAQLDKLDALLLKSTNRYQSAFDFLVGRLGQDAANDVIKKAVAGALDPARAGNAMSAVTNLDAEQLNAFDNDPSMWSLSPAVSALGTLAAKFPERFGRLVITSNFDPLIEVSIRKAGQQAWRTSLSTDGSINTSSAGGSQVIHIHGYWHGKDTLHTSTQLVTSRPTLRNDLLGYLKDKLVVVVAYGGWPDIFTGALSGIVSDDNLFPDVLWACYGDEPTISEYLHSSLYPGIKRNRVSFYRGVDCNSFFPELLGQWEGVAPDPEPVPETASQGAETITATKARLFKLAPLDCDRPPNIDVWVGRDDELRALETSHAKVVVLSGLGGEGKSVLAAHYISMVGVDDSRFAAWDWRDCKEQGDRIRTQVIQLIVRMSGGTISSSDLNDAGDDELVEVLINNIENARAILVFDNVDSYVDLENGTFIGLLDRVVQKMSTSNSNSRVILTCRPDVQYPSSSIISLRLRGISEAEAIELFKKRSLPNSVSDDEVREAHSVTDGHAFWLDLIAVQVAKVPGTTLRKFLNDLRRGREGGPDVLSSIWDKLSVGEHTLLRFMAEAVRPETAEMIEKFVASQLNLHRFRRAFRSLTTLNLVVVKPESNAPDLYDLHPLVRHFVRMKFERDERSDYIRVVITHYERIIGAIEAFLGINLPFTMLERWSQKAELEISAGMHEAAFETLVKVEESLIGGGHVQEYIRVSRMLLEAVEWETAATKYETFDHVVSVTAAAFEQLGDREGAEDLMKRHEGTIPQKTVRYIRHCDMRAYTAWLREDYASSIDWATRGVALKRDTNVDTSFDCEHTLALAQRDSGLAEVALEFFLNGETVDELIAGASSSLKGGTVYGNAGRCLQDIGDDAKALVLYRYALKILERDSSSLSRSNKSFGRRWVAEILAKQGQLELAEAFYLDSIRLLGSWAPVRARKVVEDLRLLHPDSAAYMSEAKAIKMVSKWIADT
jgi:tetratricopeptide (TPR) repeat protein